MSPFSASPNPLGRRLFHSSTKEAWAPLLDAITALNDLAVEDAPRSPERYARARAIHARIVTAPDSIAEPLPPEPQGDAPQHTRRFIEAALVWIRFADLAATEVLRTLPSSALERFPVDLPADERARDHLRRALCRAFAVAPAELDAIEREIDSTTTSLRVKQRLTAVLRRHLAQGSSPEERLALMRRFYGPVPFVAGEVDLVITSTFVFFCIPFENEALLTPGWAARTEDEREDVRRFLRWLQEGNSAKSDRFPAFGAFDRERLDLAFATELAAELGAGAPTPEAAHEQLAQMAVVLPSPLIDQYLIHDAYGHAWQGDLCDFATDYRRLVHITDPLGAASGACFGGQGAPRLRDAFVARGGATALDEEALLSFAEADIAGRVAVGLNALVAEILADLVEAKFIHLVYPDPARFPSSSLLPEAPMKIDLSALFIRDLVRWWRTPYQALAESEAARAGLAEELAALGLPRAGLDEAVAAAARLLAYRLRSAFADHTLAPSDDTAADRPQNLFTSILLANASLARELERDLTASLSNRDAEPWLRPEACLDFLVLLLGWFYRRGRADGFFHLDALLRDELRPRLLRLRDALAAEAALDPR